LHGVHRWNGLAWERLPVSTFANELVVYQDDLVVNVPGASLGRFDGTTVVDIGPAGVNNPVPYVLDGELYCTGSSGVFRLHSTGWTRLGGDLGDSASSLVMHNGQPHAAGGFLLDSLGFADVIAWDGTEWNAVGWEGPLVFVWFNVESLASYQGELYAGGTFLLEPIPTWRGLARLEGNQWVLDGPSDIYSVGFLGVVGHRLMLADGWAFDYPAIVRAFDGRHWRTIAEARNGPTDLCDIASMLDFEGELVMAGRFTSLDGRPANIVGRAVLPACCGSADVDGDGEPGSDADIEAFFECLAGRCCAACGVGDFDDDGDARTDGDIEAFFRVLAGGGC
jgi:hypothetical protein